MCCMASSRATGVRVTPTWPNPLLCQAMTTAVIKNPILRMWAPILAQAWGHCMSQAFGYSVFAQTQGYSSWGWGVVSFFFLSPALYINYLCTRSNDITLSFPTSAQKRSFESFYASLNLSLESLQTHLDSAASSPALAPWHHPPTITVIL